MILKKPVTGLKLVKGNIVKKFIVLVPIVAMLMACNSAPKEAYERRAYEERERQERLVERALDKAPKWMSELPKSTSAVYENGSAVSPDMGMSVNKAKTMAFGKLCMAAGGRVNQQSKIYRTDSEAASTEFSEMAIKSFCPSVDITGVEVVETKMVSEGARFRSYVLLALPTGDANRLVREREARDQRRVAETRSREAFKELDAKPQ
jgi:hypothetical protein